MKKRTKKKEKGVVKVDLSRSCPEPGNVGRVSGQSSGRICSYANQVCKLGAHLSPRTVLAVLFLVLFGSFFIARSVVASHEKERESLRSID